MNQFGDVLGGEVESAAFIDNPRLWEGLPSQTNIYDDVFEQTHDMFKAVIDNSPVLSEILQTVIFGRFQSTLGSNEAQFENNLDVISAINQPCIKREMAQPGDMTTHPNHESLELQSFIDSVRTTLHRHGPISPHSHLVNARERERRLDQATSTFQNRVTEFTVNLIMRHESHVSVLEGRIQALEERIQALEV